MVALTESVVRGRHCAEEVAENSHLICKLQRETETEETETERPCLSLTGAFETVKPTASGTPLPIRSHT